MPEYCWYPWLKNELEREGHKVIVPAMPDTENPKQSTWVPFLRDLIVNPSEDIILVGHSVGCITILRYLEGLAESERVGGAVLVAGFTDDLGFEELKNYFETPINFEKIRSHCDRFIAIHSDNDPFVPLAHADKFKEKLGAEVTVLHDMNHFSGSVDNEESCLSLPEAKGAVLTLIQKNASS